MLQYSLKRICLALLVAVTVSFLSFMLVRVSGDPAFALAGENASESELAMVRQQYGLDRPVLVQYFDWAGRALHGDLGQSPYFKEHVVVIIGHRLQVTMILGLSALAFALILSIPLGVVAAIRPNTWIDRLALGLSVFGQAMPSFWFGLILILIFSVKLRWFPVSGSTSWRHLVLPTIALGYYGIPAFMRLTRSGMMDVLSSDYIRTARAKGLRAASVIFKHALRNAIIPVVSVVAVQLGFMLGGSVVIESVFAINGFGLLAYESIARADLPMIQAIVLILSLIYVVLTLLADILNALLDPRIRVS
ncbi:MAG: ABC transporter permease [Deltaproteobacteria bacterium]|nr:ABC transporter permease [Candidatus Tharpella sp.]